MRPRAKWFDLYIFDRRIFCLCRRLGRSLPVSILRALLIVAEIREKVDLLLKLEEMEEED